MNKILLPVLGLIIGGVAVFGVTQASAQGTNGISGLAAAIAQKFNLDQTQVQNTIQGFRSQHQTDAENTRLDKLVSAGKINATQKQAILDELSKLKSEYPMGTFQNLTPQERQQKMQAIQQEINSWAQSQGINAMYLRPGFRFGLGMKRGWGKMNPSPTPSV